MEPFYNSTPGPAAASPNVAPLDVCSQPLSTDQREAVWTTTLVVSIFSLMGSSFVVVCYFLMFAADSWLHIPRLKKFLFKLAAWTAMAHYIWFAFNVIDRILVMSGHERRQELAMCLLGRVVFQFGSFSSLVWTVCTGVFVLFCAASVFTPDAPPSTAHYVTAHGVSWTLAAAVASVPIFFVDNVQKGEFGNCILKGELYIYSWLVPVGMIASLATIIWVLVFIKVRYTPPFCRFYGGIHHACHSHRIIPDRTFPAWSEWPANAPPMFASLQLRCSKPKKMQVSQKLQRKQRTFGNRVVLLSFTAVLWLPNIATYILLENKTSSCWTYPVTIIYALLRNSMGLIHAIAFGSLAHQEIAARYGLATRTAIGRAFIMLGLAIISPILVLPFYIRHLYLALRRLIRRCKNPRDADWNSSDDEFGSRGSTYGVVDSPLLTDTMGTRYVASNTAIYDA